MKKRAFILMIIMAMSAWLVPDPLTSASAKTTSSLEVTNLKATYSVEKVDLQWSITSTTNLLNFLIEEKKGEGSWIKRPLLTATTLSASVPEGAGQVSFRVWAVVKVGNKEVTGTVTSKPAEEKEPPKEEPPVEGKEVTAWHTASSTWRPLTDEKAALCIKSKAEQRPENESYNKYIPSSAELETFHKEAAGFNPLSAYVTGQAAKYVTSTTDNLIQFEACKWEIPTDWMRAEYIVESHWRQSQLGDFASSNFWSTPSYALASGGAYTSLGITQVKSRPTSDPHPGTKDLRWKSVAFNIDYQMGILNYYYNGYCGWCSYSYKGQQWPSVGAWFSPGSNDSGAVDYQNKVKAELATKPWLSLSF